MCVWLVTFCFSVRVFAYSLCIRCQSMCARVWVCVCVRVFTFQFSVYFDCVKECIQFGVSEQTRKCCACICHKNLTCSHEMLFSCERSMSFTRRRTPNCQNEVFHSCHVYRHRHRHRAIGPVLASTVFFLCWLLSILLTLYRHSHSQPLNGVYIKR